MQRNRFSSRKTWERRTALLFTTLFAWTFILAPGVTALSEHRIPNTQHLSPGYRRLSASEMGAIRGALGDTHVLSYSPNAGTPYPWEGNASGGVNTGNGNKLTQVPIVSWTQQGVQNPHESAHSFHSKKRSHST
jgi:hypothetical protein